jgi:hypothetical protein
MLFRYFLSSDDRTRLRYLKLMHMGNLVLFSIMYLILFLMTYKYGFAPINSNGDWTPRGFEIVFICLSLVSLGLGICWTIFTGWEKRMEKTTLDIYKLQFYRRWFILIPLGFGIILRLIGSGWHIVFSLYVISILVYLSTYPTDKKCTRWLNERNPSSNY